MAIPRLSKRAWLSAAALRARANQARLAPSMDVYEDDEDLITWIDLALAGRLSGAKGKPPLPCLSGRQCDFVGSLRAGSSEEPLCQQMAWSLENPEEQRRCNEASRDQHDGCRTILDKASTGEALPCSGKQSQRWYVHEVERIGNRTEPLPGATLERGGEAVGPRRKQQDETGAGAGPSEDLRRVPRPDLASPASRGP